MSPNPFRYPEECPVYQEEYRKTSYVPAVIKTSYGLQIVSPDTPYVAAIGLNKLYFIDTRFDILTAQHIKNQIERASIPVPNEYTAIDEITTKAERKNRVTGETTFVFDPIYARALFAKGINKRNPYAELPEYEPSRDSMVEYDLEKIAGGANAA